MDDTDVRQAWDDRPRASEAIPLASYEAQRGGRTKREDGLATTNYFSSANP